MELDKIYSGEESRKVEIEFEGVKFELEIKSLTWSKKNQILSRCFNYNSDGSVQFNYDKYMKDILSEIITKAPWGETNNVFLSQIKPEFGSKLEALAPKAFEEGKPQNFFGKE